MGLERASSLAGGRSARLLVTMEISHCQSSSETAGSRCYLADSVSGAVQTQATCFSSTSHLNTKDFKPATRQLILSTITNQVSGMTQTLNGTWHGICLSLPQGLWGIANRLFIVAQARTVDSNKPQNVIWGNTLLQSVSRYVTHVQYTMLYLRTHS